MTRPDVYSYHEYTLFLRDQIAFLKATENLSLREIARLSGVVGSYLSMVSHGTRRLSLPQLEKLAPALKLDRSETSYLGWLIDVCDADEPAERLEALKKIQRFRNYQKLNPLEIEAYRYLEHWYYVAIRELAQLPEFKADAKWIRDRLRYKVSLPKIKEALKFLMENGFIVLGDEGRVLTSDRKIHCKTGVLMPALTKFHTEMLMLAAQSISEVESADRNISAYSGTLPLARVAEAKSILDEAREKIIQLCQNSDSPNSVYHFAFLAFPLTAKLEEK